MKYKEMTKFLNYHGIFAIQPVIANEVGSQLETDITDKEFEDVCTCIYDKYLTLDENPDIWELTDEELTKRGYKE